MKLSKTTLEKRELMVKGKRRKDEREEELQGRIVKGGTKGTIRKN